MERRAFVARTLAVSTFLSVLGTASMARAQYVATYVDPNTVRLEQYAGNGQTVIWGYPHQATIPGSGCQHVALPDNAPQGERSRLFATFLAAKVARRNVVLHYYPSTCKIMAFGADGW